MQSPWPSGHPLNQGLAFWILGHPALAGGGKAMDLCGQYHGTMQGAQWRGDAGRPGGLGAAIRFNGAGDVNLGVVRNMHGSLLYNASYAFWATMDNWTGATAMFIERSNVNTQEQIFTGGASTIIYSSYNGGTAVSVSSTPFGNCSWRHFVITDSGYNLNIYVDGGKWVATAASVFFSGTYTLTNIHLGNYDNAGYFLSGFMDDVRAWQNRCLTAEEAHQVYQDSIIGYPLTLAPNRLQQRTWNPTADVVAGTGTPLFRSGILSSPLIGTGVIG